MLYEPQPAYDCCRIVLFQLLNCSVYLLFVVVVAWRNFKTEQASIFVFADIVAVLASAAATSSSSASNSSRPQTVSFFSLAPEIVQRGRELMVKYPLQSPSLQKDQQRDEYTYTAPLCSSVRDSCAHHLALFHDGDVSDDAGAAEGCTNTGCSMQNVYFAAHAQLQRLTLMEDAKLLAHHTIFGIEIDTTLLLSAFSFAFSGVASGLSFFYRTSQVN